MRRWMMLAGAALIAATCVPTADAAAGGGVRFTATRAGEAKLAFTASAPRTDWGQAGRESAVLDVILDGREVANVVTFAGATPFTYTTGLGPVAAGRHDVSVRLDRAKSPPGVRAADVGK